jgi:outer membrane murein-binding lipoprotein Lpp
VSLLIRTAAALVCGGCLLTSCGDDEELRRQLIQLRGQVDDKTHEVEQLKAQVATLQSKKVAVVTPAISTAPAASTEELAAAKARIAELEQRLAEVPAAPAAPPTIGKLDIETIATRLEEDLAAKAKQLRQLVQRQSPSSRIDEISLKTIEFPPQIITPFTSAITFTVTVGNAPPMRLMFPVTADLSGSWRLPTPDEIQKAYQAAKDQPTSSVAAGGEPVPAKSKSSTSAPPGSNVAGGAASSSATRATTTASGARMSQRADGVFVFDWGDTPAASQAPASTPRPVSPGRTPTATAPSPPAPPPAAPSRGVTAPPPVMPIVGDRVIRFED